MIFNLTELKHGELELRKELVCGGDVKQICIVVYSIKSAMKWVDF